MRLVYPLVLALLFPPPFALGDEVDSFAGRIAIRGDGRLERFSREIRTLAGRIALSERAAPAGRALRAQAEQRELTRWIDRHFEKHGGRYRLRGGRDGFGEPFLGQVSAHRQAMSELAPFLRDLSRKLVDTPPIHALLRSVLQDETERQLLCLRATRFAGPSNPLQAFVKDALVETPGGYEISAAGRDRVRKLVTEMEPLLRALDSARGGLTRLAAEVAAADELHRRFKTALADPWFVPSAILAARRQEPLSASQLAALAGGMEDRYRALLEKTGAGLRLAAASRSPVTEGLERFEKGQARRQALRQLAQGVVRRIAGDDPLHDGLRRVLKSEYFLLAAAADSPDDDPSQAIQSYFKGILVSRGDGRQEVNRHMVVSLEHDLRQLRESAEAEAPLRQAVARLGSHVEDGELARALQSSEGQILLAASISEPLSQQTFDGQSAWTQQHFEARGGRYTLRQGSEPEIDAVLSRTEALQKDLSASVVTTLDPLALKYTKDKIDLLRSSVFYNSSTAETARIYRDEFHDHVASRLFQAFEGPASRSTDLESFRRLLQEQNRGVPELARNHAKLIIVIAKMPRWLSASSEERMFEGDKSWRSYQAHGPRDYARWRELVRTAVRHFRSIQGVEKYYEVWTEPDGEYWLEGVDAYLRLYAETARAVKETDPDAKVGGAVVNKWEGRLQHDPSGEPLNLELIRFAARERVPLDFISWHHFSRPVSAIQEAIQAYRREFEKNRYGKLPEFVVSEWAAPFRATALEAASFAEMMLGLYEARVDVQTVAAWQDFLEVAGDEPFASFGMLTHGGRKKPMFFVHKLFDQVSRDSVGIAVVKHEGDNPFRGGRRVVASNRGDGQYDLLIWETGYPHPLAEALSYLAQQGLSTEDFQPYKTLEQLEEAIRTGTPIGRRWATEFKRAQEIYLKEKQRQAWLILEVAKGRTASLISADSVWLGHGAKQVVTAGNQMACRMEKGEVLRMKVTVMN